MGAGWVLDFTRLMLISTQVEFVVEVGVELGKNLLLFDKSCTNVVGVNVRDPLLWKAERKIFAIKG